MKQTIRFLTGTLFVLLLGSMTVLGQYTFGTTETTIGSDNADNYSGTWNTTNEGTGFSDWTFDTSTPNGGSAGRFIGSFSTALDVNSNSFGLFANSGNNATSGASVDFPKTLQEGDSFKISVGVNFRDGAKGFDLRDESNSNIINFNVASDTYKLDGTDLFSNTYDANTVITFTFTQNASDVSWTAERSGGLTATQSGTISSITSGTIENIRLYNVSAGTNGDGGGARNLYFNSLEFNGKHVVPNGETVTLAEDKTIPYLWIESGGTFTGSDATARILTISNSASGDQSSFTNNGTWNNGSGGSTVVFTGAPSSGDVQHDIAGSSSTAFQNVTVNKTSGSSNVGADFQSNTSVDGTLRIGEGGYIATAPPSNFYGSNAILDFNQGSGANYEVNSGDNSWSTTEVPNNITITSGKVTLNEARTLTGELLIESGAELETNGNFNLATGGLLTNNGTVTGDINFLRELTGSAGYRLLSSPAASSYSDLLDAVWTQGATTGADVTNGDPNVFTWDSTSTGDGNANWDGVTDLSGTVTAGMGLLTYVYADDDFNGSDDSWPKTISVTGTENSNGVSAPMNQNANGFTLVGNPFTSTIDFDDVTKSDLTDVAYVWDPNNSGGDGGTDGNAPGGSWKTWNGSAGDLTDGLIAPFQGFFVQNDASVTSPSITFGSGSKSSSDATFLGKSQNNEASVVRLELEGNDLRNSMWLQFSENGSVQQKVAGDALEFESLSANFAKLALNKGNTLFDIAHLPFMESSYEVPLAIDASAAGSYKLTATDFDVPETHELIFHDYEKGVSEVINEDFSYSIEIDGPAAKAQNVPPLERLKEVPMLAKTTNSDQYALSVRAKSTTTTELGDTPEAFTLEQNYPNPFNPTTSIQYSVAEAGPVTLTIYNVMGQQVETLVSETKSAGSYRVSWNAANMASGIYYYRLQAGNDILTRQMTLIK